MAEVQRDPRVIEVYLGENREEHAPSKQLSVAYGETLILRDVSLEVRAGELVCLMGRNGVGKTTLLKSVMGLLRRGPARSPSRAAT